MSDVGLFNPVGSLKGRDSSPNDLYIVRNNIICMWSRKSCLKFEQYLTLSFKCEVLYILPHMNYLQYEKEIFISFIYTKHYISRAGKMERL